MKRLAPSILALSLAAMVGTASAQSAGQLQYGQLQYDQPQYGQPQYGQTQYGQPEADRYGQSQGGEYDYARVVRVDPVIQPDYDSNGAYPNGSQQHCYTRNDGYVSGDGYDGNGYGNASNGGYREDGYDDDRNDGYTDNGSYRNNGNEGARTMATVLGGVIGAVVGSQVGGGSARYATSAIGTLVGGVAGRNIYNQSVNQRRNASVTVCDPQQVNDGYDGDNDGRVAGYDVTYEYAGRTYQTRTDYHPGDRIRVRVDVRPE